MASGGAAGIGMDDLVSLVAALASLLSLNGAASAREDDEREEDPDVAAAAAAEVNRAMVVKLVEIHSHLKNGVVAWDEDDAGNASDESANASAAFNQSVWDQVQEMHAARRLEEPAEDEAARVAGGEEESDEGTVTDAPPSPAVRRVLYPGGPSRAIGRTVQPGKNTARQIVDACIRVLHQPVYDDGSKVLASQLLAELAKSEVGRNLCLNHRVNFGGDGRDIHGVIDAVTAVLGPSCPLETSVQVCRILANMCYECEAGRKAILAKPECLQRLAQVAQSWENRSKDQGEDPGQRLPVILPGFLLNFCNDFPAGVETASGLGLIDVVVASILATKTNDAVFNSCLSFLSCAADQSGSLKHLAACRDLPEAISHVLEHTTSPDVATTALELALSAVKDTEICCKMAISDLAKIVVESINAKWTNFPAFKNHRGQGCNLLVLLLANDDSSEVLFQRTDLCLNETLYVWLISKDPELQTCAALSFGNYACSEERSLELVSNGTSAELINILLDNLESVYSTSLIHAVLGALKNLAVAESTRKVVLEQGVVEICLELVRVLEASEMATQAILSKLVGTLRLSVEGHPEVANEIGSGLIGSLVMWASNDRRQFTVRVEVSRFMASLMKYSRSKEFFRKVVEYGAMPLITVMLCSSHLRMLTDATVALTIMANVCMEGYSEAELATWSSSRPAEDDEGPDFPGMVCAQLHTDLVINATKITLQSPDCLPEVKMNTSALIHSLMRVNTAEFQKMLDDLQYPPLESLPRQPQQDQANPP